MYAAFYDSYISVEPVFIFIGYRVVFLVFKISEFLSAIG